MKTGELEAARDVHVCGPGGGGAWVLRRGLAKMIHKRIVNLRKSEYGLIQLKSCFLRTQPPGWQRSRVDAQDGVVCFTLEPWHC